MKRPQGGQLQRKVKIEWSPKFAYAIGLITSDGNLSKDERHITFISKERELASKFKQALALDNKFIMSARGGEIEKKYYNVRFGDKVFYQFLNSIGLTAAKSKTIKSVDIPDNFFGDFLRGLFDGDGTIYSLKDHRWPHSTVFQISFASASIDFLLWLQQTLSRLYGVKGFICKGTGADNLRYVKGDSRRLIEIMYVKPNSLRLQRKFDRIQAILEEDKAYGKIFLQKQRGNAGLAHR